MSLILFSPAAVKTAMFDKPDGPGGDPERMKKVLKVDINLCSLYQ